MSLELLFLGGYGQFVWPAFIFTFVSYFLLYLKTKKDLIRLDKMFLIEFKQFIIFSLLLNDVITTVISLIDII